MSSNTEPIESASVEAQVPLRERDGPDEHTIVLRLLEERDKLRTEKEALARRCSELEQQVAETRALMGGQLARIEGWILAADMAHIAQFVRVSSSS